MVAGSGTKQIFPCLRTLAPSQYTIPARQPGAPRLRLLTFAVSVRGALGSEAQTFIRQLSAYG